MDSFEEILKRTDVQQLRSFLLDGVDLKNWRTEKDDRSYEQRIQSAEAPAWELMERTFPDGKELDDATDILNNALMENKHVYMEIGIRIGASLLFNLLQEKKA